MTTGKGKIVDWINKTTTGSVGQGILLKYVKGRENFAFLKLLD